MRTGLMKTFKEQSEHVIFVIHTLHILKIENYEMAGALHKFRFDLSPVLKITNFN